MVTTDLYIGLNLGSNIGTEPTTGTSTTGKDVEIRIRATVQLTGITRGQLGRLLNHIEDFVTEGGLSSAGVGVPIL